MSASKTAAIKLESMGSGRLTTKKQIKKSNSLGSKGYQGAKQLG